MMLNEKSYFWVGFDILWIRKYLTSGVPSILGTLLIGHYSMGGCCTYWSIFFFFFLLSFFALVWIVQSCDWIDFIVRSIGRWCSCSRFSGSIPLRCSTPSIVRIAGMTSFGPRSTLSHTIRMRPWSDCTTKAECSAWTMSPCRMRWAPLMRIRQDRKDRWDTQWHFLAIQLTLVATVRDHVHFDVFDCLAMSNILVFFTRHTNATSKAKRHTCFVSSGELACSTCACWGDGSMPGVFEWDGKLT